MHHHQTIPLQNQRRTKKPLKKSISQNELTSCYIQQQQQQQLQPERYMKRKRKRSEPNISKILIFWTLQFYIGLFSGKIIVFMVRKSGSDSVKNMRKANQLRNYACANFVNNKLRATWILENMAALCGDVCC